MRRKLKRRVITSIVGYLIEFWVKWGTSIVQTVYTQYGKIYVEVAKVMSHVFFSYFSKMTQRTFLIYAA